MRPLKWMCLIALLASAAPRPASAGRPVVIEEFTGTWCVNCYAAGCALDRIAEEFPRSAVIVLAYHGRDSFHLEINDKRLSLYTVTGYPTVWFNGVFKHVGGLPITSGEAGITHMYDQYKSFIAQEQLRTLGVEPFALALNVKSKLVDPSAVLTIDTTGYPNPVLVQGLMIEDVIPYAATNGQTILNAVVRKDLGTTTVTMATHCSKVLNLSSAGLVECCNVRNLHLVVIVQDTVTKEVLGATGDFGVKNAARRDWRLYR
ncbi:MAG: hypothetical protein ABFD69_12755 [Candidatus Sumerlaeia bacterium]